jgi:hypothetical protein
MPQSTTFDVKGLWTYPSDVSGVPLGSFNIANNVNINRTGLFECRRGFDYLTFGLPSGSDRLKALIFWNGETFGHYGTTFAFYDSGSGWLNRGSLSAPANATSVKTIASQNKNLYLTTSAGLYKTDAITSSIYAAGAPEALTMDLVSAGAGTAVPTATWVTYQYLIGRKDGTGNVQKGEVSGLFTFNNTTGGTINITSTCYLPAGVDTSFFIQLYRSPSGATTPSPTGPQLVSETPITSTHISQGYAAITDITPDSQLGATIYTDSSQEGIANNNSTPPLACDIAEFKGCMFYADIIQKHILTFNLLGVTGWVAGTDTVTITRGATTEVYTAGAAFNSATKTFLLSTGGSVAQNIDATAKSLAKCINLASALCYAQSIPEVDGSFPGKVSLKARALGTAAFTCTSTKSASFSPAFAGGTPSTSVADTSLNGLMFSKNGLPEAVPLKNLFKVGAADDRIKRIKATRDTLFIYKESGGLYVLTGENEATFAVKLLDNTAKLVAPDSLVVVNNLAYGLFESGICEVSETGVSIISTPIKDLLLPLFGTPLSVLKSLSFGIANEIDGKYILSLPTLASDTYTNSQIVYDTYGKTFCTWDMKWTCGAVNPVDRKMYAGQGLSNYVQLERKAFDATDYADFGATCTITAYSGTTVTVNNTSLMSPGDILSQGTGAIAYVESVNSTLGTVVVDTAQTWTLSTADVTLYKAIDCRVQWNADSGGNAAGLKQYYECLLLTKQAFQKTATLTFSSDSNPAEDSITLTSASGNGAWGQFDWGDEVFGGEQAKAPKRVGIPQGISRCSQLSVRFEARVAFNDFQVAGLALSFNPTSTRTTR